MRIECRIKDSLDSCKIKSAVFSKGMITIDGDGCHSKAGY
jgi:hypothetical protein